MSDVFVKMLLKSQDGNITPSAYVLMAAMSRVRLTRDFKTKLLVLLVFSDWNGVGVYFYTLVGNQKTQRGDRPIRSHCTLPFLCSPQD